MNHIEKLIHSTFGTYPFIRIPLVAMYQRLCSVFPIKDYQISEFVQRKGFFFGFHDKCPWSVDNKMLLSHKIHNMPLRFPREADEVTIGYFVGPDFRDFRTISKTRAWNWQQGSMLSWLGSSLNIIFNDFDGQRNISRIVTQYGEQIIKIPKPIAAISSDGKKALTYSFSRLKKCDPAYSYANSTFKKKDETLVPDKDGIEIIDLKSSKINKLFSIRDIFNICTNRSMQDAYHYFSHCHFSPSNNKFIFYHRWLKSNGILHTRMISYDLMTDDLFIFPTNGMVSHYCWYDDQSIIAYANTEKYGDKYYMFKDRTNDYSVIGCNELIDDGHPQVSTDKKWILTDTYPDRFRKQKLIIYDMQNKRTYKLLSLRIPFEYRYDVRCDFHPRFNRDSTLVCFDSAHTGIRSLCTINLSTFL